MLIDSTEVPFLTLIMFNQSTHEQGTTPAYCNQTHAVQMPLLESVFDRLDKYNFQGRIKKKKIGSQIINRWKYNILITFLWGEKNWFWRFGSVLFKTPLQS